MMKTMRILGLAAAAALLAAPGLRADTVVLKANIPFDFVVADRQLPGGEYRFVQSEYPGVVQIYSSAQRHVATALCQPFSPAGGSKVELVFHRHGDQRFLKMIRRSSGSGYYFPQTASETIAEARVQAGIAGMQ